MPPSSGANRMAQYARNASLDSGLPNGNNTQSNQQRSDAPQFLSHLTHQSITEPGKLPAPKPLAPTRALASHIRQPNQSSLPQQPIPAPMQASLNLPDSPPPRQQRQRAHSRGSDATGFWPESHIDSQFGSPTTHRSERYDVGITNHTRSPPPPIPTKTTLGNMQRSLDSGVPYIIGKDGSMRLLGNGQGQGLPATQNDMPPPRMGQQVQDAYLSEPIYDSPGRRAPKVALHATTVRRSYEPSVPMDDEQVFSDSPTHKVPQSQPNLRRIIRKGKTQEPRRPEPFEEDEEIEGSLASDYLVSEDDHGTPRANRKKITQTGPTLQESPLPATTHGHRDKSRKRSRESCDYADDELKGMTYSQLREQPFDDDPARTSLRPVGPLTGDSLPVKLGHFRGQREADQKEFFRQMTVSDWERSGDWFLEQFGQVAQKLKEARKSKRGMVDRFETEIASREEAVRVRTENISKKLNTIKHKGEDMLADKEI
ncbi:extracellular mutant protein 11-domain-containing protein [Colletotrichum cereale]|nr:extracellular mutant protein 11-domain-containing protein [Colletotrichum cereale]